MIDTYPWPVLEQLVDVGFSFSLVRTKDRTLPWRATIERETYRCAVQRETASAAAWDAVRAVLDAFSTWAAQQQLGGE